MDKIKQIEDQLHLIIRHLDTMQAKGEKYCQIITENIGLFEISVIFKEPKIDFLPSYPIFHHSSSGKIVSFKEIQEDNRYNIIPLIRISDSINLQKLFSGETIEITNDISDYDLNVREIQLIEIFGMKSMYLIPLVNDGLTFGFIVFWTTKNEYLKLSKIQLHFIKYITNLFTPDFHIAFLRHHLYLTNARLSKIFETTTDLFIFLKQDGIILDINNHVKKILGYQPEEVIGRNIKDFIILPDNITEIKLWSDNLEYQLFRTSNYEERLLEISSFSDLDAEDNSYVFWLGRDQAERQNLLSEIIQSEKTKSLALLAGGIAHDFNNYLSAIEANASLLEFYLSEGKKEQMYDLISNIHQVVEKSQRLTNQLVTFSQGGNINPEPIDIEGLIHETVLFTLTGTDIVSSFSSNLEEKCFVLGDVGLLSQVFTNIILNSREALEDKIDKRIDISFEKEGVNKDYIVIEIRDNGIGIPDHIIDQVFDPFFTTNKAQGSGLGLSTSKSIIEEHHGKISVKSEIGQYTALIIKLPRYKGEVLKIEKQSEVEIETSSIIWILDDVKEIRNSLENLLTIHGQIVETFDTGEELIKTIETTPMYPDLLILDLTNKLGYGGKRVMEELIFRQISIPICFISGYSKNLDASQLTSYKNIEFIPKPIKERDLLRVINKLTMI